MRIQLIALTAIVLAAVAAVPVRAQDFTTDLEKTRAELPALLVELGKWCEKRRLHDKKTDIANHILTLDEDQPDARKWLGFAKKSDGSWGRSPRMAKKGDRDRSALAQYPHRRAEVLSGHTTRVLALLDQHPGLAGGTVERVLADLVELSPADASVRRRHDEIDLGAGEWVLSETVMAAEVRAALTKTVAEAFTKIGEPAAFEPSDFQQKLGVEWRGASLTYNVQALSTTSPGESARAALCAEAAPALLRAAVGAKRKLWAPYRLYLLHTQELRIAFVGAHPALQGGKHKRRTRELGGYWIPNTNDFGTWLAPSERRIDATTRQTVNKMLLREFGVDSGKHAWAGEGFGLRLTWQLCGTRLNWMVGQSRYGNAEGEDLRSLSRDEDWYRAARELLAGDDAPALRDVLHRPLRIFTAADALVAHAFAAYLLEGRANQCNDLLRRIGKSERAEDAIREATGLDLPALDLRFRRWLAERPASD